MYSTTLTIRTPKNLNFWSTIYSHGWCSLPPFSVDKENHTLNIVVTLRSGKTVKISISESNSSLKTKINALDTLSPADIKEIRHTVKDCFRLNEDFSEFFEEAKHHNKYKWISKIGAGRMLRAPSVFEDIIKTICTTNCTWALTTIMVKNLVDKLGSLGLDSVKSFPSADAIADVSENFLRKEIKAGYRAPYILECAQNVSKGKINLESLRSQTLNEDTTTEELNKILKSIKGIGPYAAGNMMKLLGRYDELALDSWIRQRYYELHTNGVKVNDKTIIKHYKDFGKWRGLFFWLEMTKYWYEQKHPF